MTAHIMLPDLSRKSFVIACRRIKGKKALLPDCDRGYRSHAGGVAHPLEDSQHGNRQCLELQQGFQGPWHPAEPGLLQA